MTRPARLGIYLALAAVVIVWGAAYPIVKYMLRWLSPMELMLARFWLAGLPLLVLAWRFRAEIAALARRRPWHLLALALTGVPGYHLTFNHGTQLLSDDPRTAGCAAMLASILVASLPAWTALLARLAGQERLSPRQWLGQAVAFAGAVLLIAGGRLSELRVSSGALLVLGAPLAWSLYSVAARPVLAASGSSLPVTIASMLAGTLLMTPFTPASIGPRLAAMGPGPWAGLAFLAVGSTFAGYVVWSKAVRELGANQASTSIYFIPLVSIATSALTLEERLGWGVALGGAMILGGVLLTSRAPRRPAAGA